MFRRDGGDIERQRRRRIAPEMRRLVQNVVGESEMYWSFWLAYTASKLTQMDAGDEVEA